MGDTEYQELIDAWIAGAQELLAPMNPLHPDWPDVSSDDRGPDVLDIFDAMGEMARGYEDRQVALVEFKEGPRSRLSKSWIASLDCAALRRWMEQAEWV